MADSEDGSATTNYPPTKRHKPWLRPEIRLPRDLSRAGAADILNACERRLATGDVFLCYPRFRLSIPGIISLVVMLFVRMQALHIFGGFHRKWIHSALYTGNGTLIEKKPTREWKTYTLVEFMSTRVVLIRRPVFELSADEREKLLSKAISLARAKYGGRRISEIVRRTIAGLWRNFWAEIFSLIGIKVPARPSTPIEQRVGMICNEYVDYCYADAKNRTLLPEGCGNHIDNMFVPAAHSWTPDMSDADILAP